MSLLRFFYDRPLAEGPCVLSVEESRHAASVYRLRVGDEITLIDGRGGVGNGVVTAAPATGLVCDVRQVVRLAPPPVCELWCAFPRAGGADDVVRRAIEVGATVIRPVLAARGVWRPSESGDSKTYDRWNKIAIAAIKQCGAAFLPRWEPVVAVSALPPRVGRLALFGSTQTGLDHAAEVVARHGVAEIAIALIGPEGGWTPDEESTLLAWGAHPVSLGRNVLRVETAATVLTAILASRPSP